MGLLCVWYLENIPHRTFKINNEITRCKGRLSWPIFYPGVKDTPISLPPKCKFMCQIRSTIKIHPISKKNSKWTIMHIRVIHNFMLLLKFETFHSSWPMWFFCWKLAYILRTFAFGRWTLVFKLWSSYFKLQFKDFGRCLLPRLRIYYHISRHQAASLPIFSRHSFLYRPPYAMLLQ